MDDAPLSDEMDVIEDLSERLYEWSGGIFWRGETTWQDRHRDEARQWVAYAALLDRSAAVEALCQQWEKQIGTGIPPTRQPATDLRAALSGPPASTKES